MPDSGLGPHRGESNLSAVATALSLASTTPHSEPLEVLESESEAWLGHGAGLADFQSLGVRLSLLREEEGRIHTPTGGLSLPLHRVELDGV